MKALAAVMALAVSAPASAQYDGPYKLIITWYQSGIIAIDYPNKQRCERAREAVLATMRERALKARLPPESGEIAFCIPG